MTTNDEPALRLALARGLVDAAQLEAAREALAAQAGSHRASVLDLLIERGQLDARRLAAELAAEFGMHRGEPGRSRIAAAVLGLLPREFVLRHGVLPLGAEGGVLQVATADPLDVEALDQLELVAGMPVETRVAAADELRRAVSFHYAHEPERAAPGLPSAESAAEGGPDSPVVRIVETIVAEAVRRRASDIHLEPLAGRFRVRYRIDGTLVEAEPPPRRLQAAIVSRVKIMANISIAEKRLPQDGRIRLALAGRDLDLRVSTLPTAHGESVVMRLLDRDGLKPGLAELGLAPDDRAAIQRLLAAPDGMVLVTGPTGSGKTTTLYAALHGLNRPDRKIITVEDPVEYQLAGVNQVPVNPATGMTFAAALRAMLRQAPNIVMVGEVRDRETAEIATNAALTGHLVLSTLHTNDAPGAVARLADIGVKPFLAAAALRAVVAQRLVRRVCAACARPVVPTGRELRSLEIEPAEAARAALLRGTGCPVCAGTGFRGRLGIFEILTVDETVRRLIYERAGTAALRACARAAGMRTLRDDGRSKVLAGLTTIEEVNAVTAGDPGGPG